MELNLANYLSTLLKGALKSETQCAPDVTLGPLSHKLSAAVSEWKNEGRVVGGKTCRSGVLAQPASVAITSLKFGKAPEYFEVVPPGVLEAIEQGKISTSSLGVHSVCWHKDRSCISQSTSLCDRDGHPHHWFSGILYSLRIISKMVGVAGPCPR